jgi:cytochrome c biogenesis protein
MTDDRTAAKRVDVADPHAVGRSETGYRPEGIDDDFVRGVESGTGGGGAPGEEKRPVQLPTLGLRGTLRWMWRQLTSMRVALILLMLLAVAAVPGSILPQRGVDPAAVQTYLSDNPTSGKILDRLGFFDVFTSPWFSAIYLLLFVSLVGCIIPRALAHIKAARARPPRTPRRFERFPAQARATTTATPDEAAEAAAKHLRGRVRWLPTFRVELGTDDQGRRTVAAERGYLRESGNILFHVSLLCLLVAIAFGQMLHYRGQVIVTEGHGFANSMVDYDTFQSGSLFRASSLDPFSLNLDKFTSEFTDTASAEPRDFTAFVTVRKPGHAPEPEKIRINHPLNLAGAKVYLQGNGYAPDITVRDAKGRVAFSGPVVFVVQDAMYTSRGVVKVPDVSKGLDQLGLVGFLLPTATNTANGAVPSASIYPQPLNPELVLNVWHGNLGLDDGLPQNVYRLDTTNMKESLGANGAPSTLTLQPGQTVKLPGGQGSVTFNSLPRYVALDLRYDPSLVSILVCALAALLGLAISLFTPRRRVWLRISSEPVPAADAAGGSAEPRVRTVVDAAGLARGDDAGLQREVDAAVTAATGDPSPTQHHRTAAASSADAPRKASR